LLILVCSGWYDPLIQNKAYVDFATNAPGYGQLQNDTVIRALNEAYFGKGGCKEQEEACYAAGNSTASNKICRDADDFCVSITVICGLVVRIQVTALKGRKRVHSGYRGS
jgi:hypothetical protein